MSKLFTSLDFFFVPASDIEASTNYYTSVLGGKLLWKIHAFEVWVACIWVSDSGPLLLVADHIKKNDLIMSLHLTCDWNFTLTEIRSSSLLGDHDLGNIMMSLRRILLNNIYIKCNFGLPTIYTCIQ
jgi:hypothetical protein